MIIWICMKPPAKAPPFCTPSPVERVQKSLTTLRFQVLYAGVSNHVVLSTFPHCDIFCFSSAYHGTNCVNIYVKSRTSKYFHKCQICLLPLGCSKYQLKKTMQQIMLADIRLVWNPSIPATCITAELFNFCTTIYSATVHSHATLEYELLTDYKQKHIH